jgi:hypothetical protein
MAPGLMPGVFFGLVILQAIVNTGGKGTIFSQISVRFIPRPPIDLRSGRLSNLLRNFSSSLI